MDKNVKPYPESMARGYPPGVKAEKRKIIRCSKPGAWYAGSAGKVIRVHYFSTFGCWDTKGRWIYYYDIGRAIIPWYRRIINWIKKLFK